MYSADCIPQTTVHNISKAHSIGEFSISTISRYPFSRSTQYYRSTATWKTVKKGKHL